MSAIGATDVTYAIQEGTAAKTSTSHFEATFSLSFGDGALTYPSGGIPLTKAKLGCPAFIKDLVFIDGGSANGYVYKYDRANEKIRMYQVPALDGNSASAQALAELGTSETPAAATLYVKVSGF